MVSRYVFFLKVKKYLCIIEGLNNNLHTTFLGEKYIKILLLSYPRIISLLFRVLLVLNIFARVLLLIVILMNLK